MTAHDPLTAFPPEIVLHILDLVPTSTLARLTRLSHSWHSFVDDTHQDLIYSSRSKIDRPGECRDRDFSFLARLNCFTNYYDQRDQHHNDNDDDDNDDDDNKRNDGPCSHSWKDLCKRQTLLRANLASARPSTTDAVIRVDLAKVRRFRADFRRRFFVSTSELGGMHVTDMDTREALFVVEQVRAHAHLEYEPETGTAAWDAEGGVVEVWRVGEGDEEKQEEKQKQEQEQGQERTTRGKFHCVTRLNHDGCEIRGFEISHGDLAVVSSDGKAFIYSLDDLRLKISFAITPGAVGHLCQSFDAVVISMGPPGFHVYSKTTGEKMGVLDPRRCSRVSHIKHIPVGGLRYEGSDLSSQRSSSIQRTARTTDRLTPLRLDPGPLPEDRRPSDAAAGNNNNNNNQGQGDGDEWGAALLDDDYMAAISKLGRLFLCPDWRRALLKDEYDAAGSRIVECQVNPLVFHQGGWLALREGRVALEVGECLYVLSTSAAGKPIDNQGKSPVCWAMLSASDARVIPVPVSFMAMGHDCFMHTYVTHCRLMEMGNDIVIPMKTIRVVSFAPDLESR